MHYQPGSSDMHHFIADPTSDEIRQRAYEIWERRHQPKGYDAEFWFEAERELKAERLHDDGSEGGTHPRSGSGSDCAS
jgi:hypothetical protein